MAKKAMKIKRYRSVSGAGKKHGSAAVRLLVLLLLAGVIFAIGWFGASHCIDAITEFWYTHISVSRPAQDAEQEQPADDSAATGETESVPEVQPEPPAETEPVTDDAGTWGEVALSALNTEDALRTALSVLSQSGADHAVLTLKDDRGYVYYDSGVEMAAEAVRAQADIALFVRLCEEYGLAPCARLEVFCDPLTAYARRDAAVHFEREGVLWLDTSAELGGKPWLNPYSADARGYAAALAQELAAAGMTDILFSGVQFPSGYALEFCYYGESAAQLSRTDCLRECVAMLHSAAEQAGANAWFIWPADAALFGADVSMVYGDGPAALGAQRILLETKPVRNAEGILQLPEADAAALNTFAAAAGEKGTQRFALDLSALAADPAMENSWLQAAQAAGFTHFWKTLP